MGRVRGLARVAAALLVIAAAVPASADARLPRCDRDSILRCGTVTVPLDRSGRVPGNLDLYVEQVEAQDLPAVSDEPAEGHQAGAGTGERGAIFALAGGPGQPATQFTSDFVFAFGDEASNRDVVTFDQRGTGRSGLLRCPEVERVVLLSRYPESGQRCAERLGDRRGLYTTSDSVDDMEAVRQAIGVDKIAIYGASYGTKVALAYAARYPEHVERLVLDSVVTPEGPDPLYRDTFAATPRVMRASCAPGCPWTGDAGADLAAFVGQLGAGPARGFVVDRNGRRRAQSIGATRLLFLMLGGDFTPQIRSALPAAVYNAKRGDPAPLLRLASLSEAGAEPASPRDFSAAIFTATICEEVSFPWQRGAPFDDRGRQAAETVARLGDSAFTPFGPTAALETDLLQLCSRWNEASNGPPSVSPPLPDVPALILEGEADLRTPLEGAQRVAAQLPQATLLTIPATGHSALGSDSSSCTLNAVTRFLERKPVRSSCGRPPRAPKPDPPAPLLLNEVDPMPRAPRSIARTLQAVDLTLSDVEEQVGTQALISFNSNEASPVRGGGLRGGRFRAGTRALSIDRYLFVPGIRVSGRLLNRAGRIGQFRVSGSPAVAGFVEYRGGGVLTGRIGGRRFRFRSRRVDTTPPEIELGAARADRRKPDLAPDWPRPKFR
jgi:pimeloyl-ACP methyl ester carboxylesterase